MIIEYISNIRTLIAFFNQFTNDPILSEICMLVNLWINSCEQIHWFVHQEHQNCLQRKCLKFEDSTQYYSRFAMSNIRNQVLLSNIVHTLIKYYFFSLAVMLEEEQCLLLLVQAVINIYNVVYIFPSYDNSPRKIRLNYRGINNIRNTYIESKWIRVSIWRNSIPFLSFMGVSMQTIYKFLCSQQIIRLLL